MMRDEEKWNRLTDIPSDFVMPPNLIYWINKLKLKFNFFLLNK